MICDCGNLAERNGSCASCNRLERKIASMKVPEDAEPIKKQSEEMKRIMPLYLREKKVFLKGKKCAVFKDLPAVDVHHMAGRSITGYYDERAKNEGICLLLDKRFWLPVSRAGHKQIEENPKWAKVNGFSEDRLVPMKIRKEKV